MHRKFNEQTEKMIAPIMALLDRGLVQESDIEDFIV